MLFIFRLLKALRLKRKLNEYIEEKKFSIKEEERQHNRWNRFNRWWKRKCPFFVGGGTTEKTTYNVIQKFRISLFTSGTYENYVLKSIIGFISGMLLTYIFFIFFILQLNLPLGTATTMCSIFGLVLSLGLAYSHRVRCTVFMLLPQFFSKRGRQALVAYAFILAFTGPAKNTLHNMKVLSETMACGQGKLKGAVKTLVDLIKKPFYAIKDSMKQIMEKIKVVVEKVKEILNTIRRTVKSIIGVIKSAYQWLNSVVSMCSKQAGTPFQRCEKAFEQAYDACVSGLLNLCLMITLGQQEKVPSLFEALCDVTGFVQKVCVIVKPIDFICELFDFVSDDIVGFIRKKLSEFSSQMKNIFYVSVKFSHTYDFHTEQSKTVKEIAAGIMMEIKQRSEKIVYFFDWMSFVFSFFFLYMLFQVLNYKRKYMTNEWFDNHFITENIIHLDIQRTRMGLETILPLNVHERKKYVHVSSIRLVSAEKRALAKSAVFLGLSTVKLSIHMLADYSLWWILQMIRYHGQFQTSVDNPSNIKVVVDGKGMLADLYSSILNTFQPTGVKFDLDTTPCLPDPAPPDLSRYKQIASLIVLAWILSICEPYGLRLRNTAMSYYYPARARVRAVWLYNHILRSRGSFLKYARRQLRRIFMKDSQGIEKISFMDRMRAIFPFLRRICKGKVFTACFLCGGVGSSEQPLVKCPRPDCVGSYCIQCYSQLQNICPLCRLPIEYGDISDMSEERDSSDEVASTVPSKGSEVASTGESDTAALLQDTAESEISFDYQYKERDIDEDRSQFPAAFKDLEAQKPRPSRASLDDYAFPIEPNPEEEEHKMTLSQRRKSGIWSLIPDADVEPDLDDFSNKELEEVKDKSIRTSQKEVQKLEYVPGEHELADPMVPSTSIAKGRKIMRKFFPFQKPKGFYRKRKIEEIDETQSEEESDVTKPLLFSPGMELSEVKESEIFDTKPDVPKAKRRFEGRQIRYLKKKLFGEEVAPLSLHKMQSDKSEDSVQGESIATDKSKGVKSSQMMENWVKTGSYHSSGGHEEVVPQSMATTAPETKVITELKASSSHTSAIKQTAVGFKNLFKRMFRRKEDKSKEDLGNIAVHKYPHDDKKRKKQMQKKEKIPKFKGGKVWKIWKREEAESSKNEDSETSSEDSTVENVDPVGKKKKTIDRRSIEIRRISIMKIEEETFSTMKRTQTPAKIVNERFKVDEVFL